MKTPKPRNPEQPNEERAAGACTIGEAADLLGVDCSSVYRLIQRQKLCAWRAPLGKRLIPRTELSRILCAK